MSRHSVLPMYSDDPNVTETDVVEKAWKYVGYKVFSRYVGSSRSFFFVRQFRTLNARIILAMQDQLVELEEEFNHLDDRLSRKDAKDIHNGSFRQETDRNRLNLIWEIQRKLKDYNEYLQTYSQIGNRSEVAARDIQSLKNWSVNNPNAILETELVYCKTGEDLVYVLPKTEKLLPQIFELLQDWGLKLFRRHPTDTIGYDPATTLLHTEERVEKLTVNTILLVGLVMLIGPMWVLEFVIRPVHSLAVITGFIVCFLALLAFATGAKPLEALGATAAYSAVLVVFLQIPH